MFEGLPAVQVGDDSQVFVILSSVFTSPLSRLLTCLHLFGFVFPPLVYICLQISHDGVGNRAENTQISSHRLFQRPVFADLNYVKVGMCIKIK